MAFLKFKWPTQANNKAQVASTVATPSVEDLRKRASYRLLGASVLIVIGVIGFSLLFDTQPRPVKVDIPIEIPNRDTATALVEPKPHSAEVEADAQTRVTEPVTSLNIATPVSSNDALAKGEEWVADNPPAKSQSTDAASTSTTAPIKPSVNTGAKPAVKPNSESKQPATAKVVVPKPSTKPPKLSEAERARALLEGRPVASEESVTAPAAADATSLRFVVQAGAFSDEAKMQAVRAKLENAGVKTYIQTLDTSEGKRTRVRVGPFSSRSEATKVEERIKKLGLQASVLSF